jgi:hypothetical protein
MERNTRVEQGPDSPSELLMECTLVKPPKHGSYNFVYTLEFNDGVQWIFRVPIPDTAPKGSAILLTTSRSISSEVFTMSLIRNQAPSFPIPEIYCFESDAKQSYRRTFHNDGGS